MAGRTLWDAVAERPPTIALATLRPYAAGERHPAIRAASLHLLVCTAGGGVARVAGTSHRLATGSLLAVPWAAALELVADGRRPFTLISLHLVPWAEGAGDPPSVAHAWATDAHAAALPLAPPGALPPLPASPVTVAPELAAAALSAVWIWNDRSGDPALRRLRLRAVALAAATAGAPVPQPQDPRVARLLGWLRAYCHRPISRAEMCRRSGLGPAALGRALRAATGRSPTGHLIDLRLERAHAQVIASERPLAAIAEEVGIPDPSHFARLFRHRFGHTPAALRRARA